MAEFEFTVDTTEMAESIRDVAGHVNGVTLAVIAMQTAVIAAENAGADQICENVDRGFYSLIRSQISQKIAALRSKVDARMLEMRQQSISLGAVKARMERDFAMIASRYTRLFNSLDASLRSRIFELDKAAVTLHTREYGQISSRALRVQASIPMNQLESVSAHQSIVSGRTRSNAMRTIRAMHHFVLEATQQRLVLSRMLMPSTAQAKLTRSIPVIMFETDSLRSSQTQWSYRFPKPPDEAMASRLESEVSTAIFGDIATRPWVDIAVAQRSRVDTLLRHMIDAATLTERVRANMVRLASQASWQMPGGKHS